MYVWIMQTNLCSSNHLVAAQSLGKVCQVCSTGYQLSILIPWSLSFVFSKWCIFNTRCSFNNNKRFLTSIVLNFYIPRCWWFHSGFSPNQVHSIQVFGCYIFKCQMIIGLQMLRYIFLYIGIWQLKILNFSIFDWSRAFWSMLLYFGVQPFFQRFHCKHSLCTSMHLNVLRRKSKNS